MRYAAKKASLYPKDDVDAAKVDSILDVLDDVHVSQQTSDFVPC